MSAITPGDVSVIVIAKAPRAGFAKTRLIPDLGAAAAARLAAASLADTLWAVAAAPVARRVLVLDGDAGGAAWLPRVAGRQFEVIGQRRGDLGKRLAGAFTDSGAAPALLIGMDTPQITGSLLATSAAALCSDGVDAVLGPAVDGGWWAIGLREPEPAAFAGVPMSAEDTGERQRTHLAALGLRVRELARLRDVDTVADARAVAATSPWTRMAAALREAVPEPSATAPPLSAAGRL